MTPAPAHVLEVLAALDVWPEPQVQVLKRLSDGPTNEVWKIAVNGSSYVLRLVKPLAAKLGLSLAAELDVLAAAHNRHLAPAVIASCATRGAVLSRYIEGRPWTDADLHDPAQLTRLGKTMREVHQLDCAARPADVRATIHHYARLSGDARAAQWRDHALTQLEGVSARDPVVCHRDVTAANIVDQERLCLIDWEYAAHGDPLFDLAVVVVQHELDAAAAAHLIAACLGRVDANVREDLRRWCRVYRNIANLWQSIVDVADITHR
ncbi:MAG: phosphotransferase [Gammaproteobacteria bacterium]